MLKKLIVPVFILWEKIYSWIYRIRIVDNSPYQLLRIAVHPHKGEPLPLDKDDHVQPGDYVAELHISNIAIARGKVGNVTVASDVHLLPLFRKEMQNLAALIRQGKLDTRVKALWGVTLFGPGVRRLGFSVRPMPPGRNTDRLINWMTFLRWVFSPPTAKKPSKTSAGRQPKEFWISTQQFTPKYSD